MNSTLRAAVATLFLAASALPAAAQTDPHQHETPGMMGGQDMGGMMRMMQGCPMMQGGGHALPHLPPGNEKLELQMHADMMKAMGDIMAKYAARLPEKK